MNCPNGHPVPAGSKFCPECGAVLTSPVLNSDPPLSSDPAPASEHSPLGSPPTGPPPGTPGAGSSTRARSPRSRIALISVAVLAVLALGGGVVAVVSASSGDSEPSESSAGGGTDFDADDCVEEIGTFVDALNEINSRLDVGMNVSELSTRLGDAKVAYDKVDVEDAVSACGDVAADAEAAFNAYVKSVNQWNDCIESTYCTPATPQMQSQWSKASGLLAGISTALEGD